MEIFSLSSLPIRCVVLREQVARMRAAFECPRTIRTIRAASNRPDAISRPKHWATNASSCRAANEWRPLARITTRKPCCWAATMSASKMQSMCVWLLRLAGSLVCARNCRWIVPDDLETNQTNTKTPNVFCRTQHRSEPSKVVYFAFYFCILTRMTTIFKQKNNPYTNTHKHTYLDQLICCFGNHAFSTPKYTKTNQINGQLQCASI